MQTLLTAIVLWLAANFDLPANFQHPEIVFAPPEAIGSLHHQDFLIPAATGPAENADASHQLRHQVVAVYDSMNRTIYLPVGWTGTNAAELSVLVHEMVHHLQNLGSLKYECAQARERVAFQAQQRWLRMLGSDLSEALGIDAFSLLVRTSCGY